jgi:hypothetical protein
VLSLCIIPNAKRWFVICLCALLAGLPGFGQTDPSAARELFEKLNLERARNGLKSLQWDERLSAAATSHAAMLGKNQQLSHVFPGEPPLQQRLSAVPLALSGENVGVDSSIAGVHQGFMHSPPHRANILNPHYDAVGIGIVMRDGRYWVAQDFALRIPEVGDAQAEAEAIGAASHIRSGLRPTQDIRLRRLACHMAHSGQLNEEPALELPDAHHAIAYTSLDPRIVPEEARRVLDSRDSSRVAVGACFAHSPQYPSGVYWLLMVLFGKGRGD